MLQAIPYAKLRLPKPAKVIVKPLGNDLAQGNRFFNWIARKTTMREIRDFHQRQREAQKETYAESWVLAA